MDKINEFVKELNEAQIVRNTIELRKAKRIRTKEELKRKHAENMMLLMMQHQAERTKVGSSPELSAQHQIAKEELKNSFRNNFKGMMSKIGIDFKRKITDAKLKEIKLGLDRSPPRQGRPVRPRRGTMLEMAQFRDETHAQYQTRLLNQINSGDINDFTVHDRVHGALAFIESIKPHYEGSNRNIHLIVSGRGNKSFSSGMGHKIHGISKSGKHLLVTPTVKGGGHQKIEERKIGDFTGLQLSSYPNLKPEHREVLKNLMNFKTLRESVIQNLLNEARRGSASPSKQIKKTRTEVRSAARGADRKKRDAIRKQEDRRQEGKTPKFAVVLGRDKKIKIVQKKDIGKSKVIVSPDKFDKGKAKRYLEDPKFEITDSSKKLFPEFKRKKAEKKEKPKKKEEKKGKKKAKSQGSTLTKKSPREVMQKFPLPKTPPKGKKVTAPKSQYDDWDHSATDLEEAIPAVLNQIFKVKTDTDIKSITEKLGTSQTLMASAQRAANQIVEKLGPVVAIHMGKNNGKLTKQWLTAGGVNATSKSDIVFVPQDLWKKAGGKLEKVDPKKCIRASMKCGASRILNGESGEAIATIEAANRYAGNIVAKNAKVAKLFAEAKSMISRFAKSAELGQYEIGEIKRISDSGETPKDKNFAKYRKIVQSQEKLMNEVAAKIQEIFDASEEFKMGLILESFTGNEKFGQQTIQAANYVLGMNNDGTGIKLESITEKLIEKITPDLQFRGAFKGRSRKVGGKKIRTLSTLYNIDYKPSGIMEDIDLYQQEPQIFNQPQEQSFESSSETLNFAGTSAIVEQDLKMIGDDVLELMNYCDLEPSMISSNELDVTDYMEGGARNYNIITIDGKRQIAIPVQDFQQFDNLPQSIGEQYYTFINEFLSENLNNTEGLDLALTSGLVSPETIQSITDKINIQTLMNEMWENSLLNPETFEVFAIEARNYRKEYDNYHSKPEQRANRSKRVLARRKMMKNGRVHKGDGKDVHHEDGNPQNNGDGNLKVLSKSKNRSMNEEHGAGEEGTKELLDKYIKDTPYATNPIIYLKKVVKNGIKRK